ncbi:MAG: class I SAM-dependent methyltransferase [bacterium]
MNKVDYSQIAPTYNERYKVSHLPGLTKFLTNLLIERRPFRILETGCGTGHWLNIAKNFCPEIFGADASIEMLKESTKINRNLNHLCADADNLPLRENYFDLIMCINSFHFYKQKNEFIKNAFRLLRSNGIFFIAELDPFHQAHDWYIYKYFPGTYEYDLERYLPTNVQRDCFNSAGFTGITETTLEHIHSEYIGEEVLNDKFLQKDQASQLAALSEQEYKEGINKIKIELNNAGIPPIFETNLFFTVVSGIKS